MENQISETLREKLRNLQEYLKSLSSVAVAFSGGVDSTFLLKVAHDTLGERAIAVTSDSCFYPRHELEEAKAICRTEKIRQIIFSIEPLQVKEIRENPPNRCYFCKREIFRQIRSIAEEQHLSAVVDGSNMDDNNDYRPGKQAIAELGIKSPLRHAGLWKSEIRQLSRSMGLSTWEKPSFACLASRFPYGDPISKEALFKVERAEQYLLEKNFRQVRVRVHGNMARIELLPDEFGKLMEQEVREELLSNFKEYGFLYVTLDLQGYRTGSMNEHGVN